MLSLNLYFFREFNFFQEKSVILTMSKIWIVLFVTATHFIITEANVEIPQRRSRQIGPISQDERQPVVEYFSLMEKQYLLFSERVTWEEARILCVSYDAKLAILNDLEKATGVAEALAESDIGVSEDIWLGARRLDTIWTWIDSKETAWRKNILSIEPGVDNYPPWSREPTRPTKECLAIDRKSHNYPNFVDLDCRLLRPFICEKRPEDSLKSPVPAKWMQIHRSTFTLYHGKVTWDEAATYCRKQGARLAIVKNQNVIDILTNSMTKTRPDFETVWIGAHFSYGQWVWMATGAILNSISENGYPPWSSGRSQKNKGCLLLDRHLGGNINFIETNCDRKRDFVCEEYPQDEYDAWLNDPVKFSHENETYIIYSIEKTWQESNNFCKERGSVLAFMEDINTTNVIIEAMGDHPRGISHVWTGGVFNSNSSQWTWIHNNHVIPSEKDRSGYPPWANIEGEFDFYNEASTCLNLDRSDHIRAHLYGLDCSNKQPFVCKITCNIPPEVKNGNWTCEPEASSNKCHMICEPGLITIGLRNATCSNNGGWTSSNNWLEFPECLKPSEYANRLVRSLGHEVQKIIGYYFILDHWNEKMKQLSIKFTEQLLTIFPVNRHLKMGMSSYITNPSSHMHFNQTDNCAALQTIRALETKIGTNRTRYDNSSDSWFKEISTHTGHKMLIVAIIDGDYAETHGEVLQQLISAGHRVVIIGSKEDGEVLLPLATVGLEQRVNLFLFDPQEFESVVKEMHKIKPTITINCPEYLEIPETNLIKGTTPKTQTTTLNTSNSKFKQTSPDKIKTSTDSTSENTKSEALVNESAISGNMSIEKTPIPEIAREAPQQNPITPEPVHVESTTLHVESTTIQVESTTIHVEKFPPDDLVNPVKLEDPSNPSDQPETEPRIYMNEPNPIQAEE